MATFGVCNEASISLLSFAPSFDPLGVVRDGLLSF